MRSDNPATEKTYLRVSVFGNILVGCVGVAVAALSESQAILLDGVFNLTYFLVGLFGIKVADLVSGGDDQEFPFGYSYLEPLVNGIKGSLVLGVSIMAAIGAIHALSSGGSEINAGMAIAYGVFASSVCGGVAWMMRRGAQQVDSPMVAADAENWLVNAAVSSCVLLAFAGIFLLRALGFESLVPYVDPTVVLTVVLISVGVPLRIMYDALMALLNRAPSEEIRKQVAEIVDSELASLPVQERFIRVLQPGRHCMVFVHAVLPPDHGCRISDLDQIRSKVSEALCDIYPQTCIDIMFCADRIWGVPFSELARSESENHSE